MGVTSNPNTYHYELSIDQKQYHVTYIKSDDHTFVRELPPNFTGKITNLPKIFEAYDFEQWVRDNGLLQRGLLQFNEEQETWNDSECTITFKSWLEDSENTVIQSILEFLEENGFEH
jgi:hypothetical protein